MHILSSTLIDLRAIAEVLPEGWQPGDICFHCGKMLVRHRVQDFACPVPYACAATNHNHAPACWQTYTFTTDPQVEARRRLEATMAPGSGS